MKTTVHFSIDKIMSVCILVLTFLVSPAPIVAITNLPATKTAEKVSFIEYRAKIVDKKTGTPLAYASIVVVGLNISTISNSEGEFSLKISKDVDNPKVIVSFLGFKDKTIALADLKREKARIELEPTLIELPELNVISKDAELLMRAVLEKRGVNYFNTQTLMTAFYRETIKKNRSYVSLSEAVVEVNKQPYTSSRSDAVKLYKARKKADYSKLDTVTFKLQGGPFSSLYLDIMKNPDYLFTSDIFSTYEFTFDRSTHTDNRLIYVIDFKQRPDKTEPYYYGKLYIDAQSMALRSAVFSLNITDKAEAASMFIMKKPYNARVYPTETKYRIDYLEKDGKWYYSYSRIELGLKILWKKRLFNTNYFSVVEMAVTDWGKGSENNSTDFKEKLKPSVIISDEASGFSDQQFWGEYNVIEPEKTIESAIKKIQRQLEKKK